MNGNTLNNEFIYNQIKYTFYKEYMDYFLIIEKYIPYEQFKLNLKKRVEYTPKKLSLEMLDYILLNYNILNPKITLSLIRLYDYSEDIMNRCQMYGQFDMCIIFKYNYYEINFVKMLYYIFMMLKKCELSLFLPNFDKNNFDKEECAAILEAINFWQRNVKSGMFHQIQTDNIKVQSIILISIYIVNN